MAQLKKYFHYQKLYCTRMRFQKLLLQCGDFDFLADIDCFFYVKEMLLFFSDFSVFAYLENDKKC